MSTSGASWRALGLGIAFTMSLFIAGARRSRRPPITPPRSSRCLPPRCCPPSSAWPRCRIGAPAGDHGVVPGGPERAKERHVSLVERLAASELPAPAMMVQLPVPVKTTVWCADHRGILSAENMVCTDRSPYPIRKVTTRVPVEGACGGALPMSAGILPHGAGSRTDRRATPAPWRGSRLGRSTRSGRCRPYLHMRVDRPADHLVAWRSVSPKARGRPCGRKPSELRPYSRVKFCVSRTAGKRPAANADTRLSGRPER